MENNIFDQVGKRTPFRTPDGFFEQSKESIQQSTVKPIVHRISFRRTRIYEAAASLVLAVGIWSLVRFLPQSTQTYVAEEPAYAQTEATIYSSSSDWSDFAEADLFLDNMDW